MVGMAGLPGLHEADLGNGSVCIDLYFLLRSLVGPEVANIGLVVLLACEDAAVFPFVQL